MNDQKCVHTEHCCFEHGCKYGRPDCPVVLGVKKQSFLCEDCDPYTMILPDKSHESPTRFVWFENVYGWNMTGVIGRGGRWFFGFSRLIR